MIKLVIATPLLFGFIFSSTLEAAQYKPTSECVFAIMTQKRGLASGLAHNHFVSHDLQDTIIDADPEHPTKARFFSTFKVDNLVFDDFEQINRWASKIKDYEGFSKEFTKVSPEDSAEIKTHALAENQLNAAKYPIGKIELKSLVQGSPAGFRDFRDTAVADMTISGKTSEIVMAINFSFEESALKFEGFAKAKFSQFGIEPYSAFLGAVGNKDEFFMYTNCKAGLVPKGM